MASLRLSLTPDGLLQAHLPGFAGDRTVVLRDISALETIKRIIQSLDEGHAAIGQDGAPTRQQVLHWERHSAQADSRCPFCIKNAAFVAAMSGKPYSHKQDARYAARDLGAGVTVRRVALRVKATSRPISAPGSIEELF